MGMFARKSVTAPLARNEDLIVEDLSDEVLIYDQRTDEAHCLTREVAMVWRVCDGRTTPADLAAALDLDKETVEAAIAELATCSLLNNVAPDGITRREAGMRMAKVGGAVAATPLIYSILAPTPALASSQNFCIGLVDCFTKGSGCATCYKHGCVCCGAGSSGGAGEKLCTADCSCGSCNASIIHSHCNVCNNNSTCTTGPNPGSNYKCTTVRC